MLLKSRGRLSSKISAGRGTGRQLLAGSGHKQTNKQTHIHTQTNTQTKTHTTQHAKTHVLRKNTNKKHAKLSTHTAHALTHVSVETQRHSKRHSAHSPALTLNLNSLTRGQRRFVTYLTKRDEGGYALHRNQAATSLLKMLSFESLPHRIPKPFWAVTRLAITEPLQSGLSSLHGLHLLTSLHRALPRPTSWRRNG